MQRYFRILFTSLFLVLINILILSGCTTTNAAQPTENQFQANLTSLASTINVIREGNIITDIEQGQTTNIGVHDQIGLDDGSRALLKLPNILDVEILGTALNVKVVLADVKIESGGSVSVNLNLLQGHIFVNLDKKTISRVTVETTISTIKTLEDGTEFDVCHAPENLTCVLVKKGVVEIIAQGKKEIISAGEASYILQDRPPVPAICAPTEIFIAWEENIRKSTDTPDLGTMVANLPQESCSGNGSEIANLPAAAGMVKILYGTYEVGNQQVNEAYSIPKKIPLDTYWIDIYEVTNKEYQQYLVETGDQPPVIWPGLPDHPVRGVVWEQATNYCSWAKKRLPTEAEWEVAGRGSNSLLYPWGNDPFADGKIDELPLDDSYSVGSFSFNVSQTGLYDMAGNVWEWVGEPYDTVQDGYRIIRGGRFGFIKDLTFRQQAQPTDERFIPYVGFRCASNQVKE